MDVVHIKHGMLPGKMYNRLSQVEPSQFSSRAGRHNLPRLDRAHLGHVEATQLCVIRGAHLDTTQGCWGAQPQTLLDDR